MRRGAAKQKIEEHATSSMCALGDSVYCVHLREIGKLHVRAECLGSLYASLMDWKASCARRVTQFTSYTLEELKQR